MYSAWLFFDDRFKDVYFPDQPSWTSQVVLSQMETGWFSDAIFPVRALDQRMYFTLPSNFYWEDGATAREKEIIPEKYFKIIGEDGRPISVIVKKINRDQLCFHKYVMPGRNLTVGRGDNVDVRDSDGVMSSLHGFLAFRSRDTVEYTDQSANGTYFNGRKLIRNTVRLQYGDVLTFPTGLKLVMLGNRIAVNRRESLTHIRLEPLPAQRPVPPCLENKKFESIYVQYHRAPRMLQKTDDSSIEIEPPIAKQAQNNQPLWLQLGPSMTMVLPMLMGTVIAGSGRTSSGLIMVGTSSALAVMWGLINRNYRKKQAVAIEMQRITMYQTYIAEMEQQLKELNDREYQRLISAYPNVGQCATMPMDSSRHLWDRMPTHSDFLNVRVGVGDVNLPNPIQTQKQKLSIIDDPLRNEPERLKSVYSVISDAPVTVGLRREAVVGILGQAEAVLFAQGLLMQIAALHSYHDVRIVVLTDESAASQWSWARWLPHVFANEDREMRMVVSRKDAIHNIMSHLDEILTMRKGAEADDNPDLMADEDDENATPLPHYIIFCTSYRLLEDEPIMRRLLTNKLGMTLVMIAPSLELLPKECHLVFNVASKPGFLHTSDGDTKQIDFEYPNRNLLAGFAQQVASLRVRDAAENAAIPTLVSFLDVYGVRRTEDLDVWRMWTENHTWQGIRSIIGYGAGSKPFILDISDKYHGPHGLIAGTTGSGKSVMLETYILSLALNYSPNEVQFILIDYKGGGMADEFRDLPHVAGIIDNLQGERVISRALASLNGEIHRRERIFKAYNVNNINDYSRNYGDDPSDVKLPHLIIIVDEFAELKSEQPDFMRELVSASRVGRSLGIHLILATQKPSNSVSDEIWANSRFHLCLRVQTRSDSMEMLKRPDAAYIKGMGRCFIQIGNDEIFDQVQTSYSGLAYNPNEPRAEEMPHLLDDTGHPIRVPKKRKKGDEEKELTQMRAVLQRIGDVAGHHGMAHSKRMWLPEMPAQIYFDSIGLFRDGCVRDGAAYPNAPENISFIMGMADDVAHQRYVPCVANLTKMRNLMIVGLAGSGKTTAVQSMAYSLASRYDPDHLQMYVLSLTSQTLGTLSALPHMGDIAFENDVVEIKRFINMLYEEEERRSDLFAKAATDSFIEYNRSQRLRGLPAVPAIVVFVDRFEQLKGMFANDDFYTNRIHNLLREGSGRGIHFIVTALAKNEVPAKLHAFFSGVALQLRERGDFSDVLGKRVSYEMPPIAAFPGRGMALLDDGKPYEIQLALGCTPAQPPQRRDFAPLEDPMAYIVESEMPTPGAANSGCRLLTDVERAEQITAFANRLNESWKGQRPPRIPRIPENATYEQFIAEPVCVEAQKTPYSLPIGYDMAKGSPVTVDIEKGYSWMVTGPKKSGRTNMLKLVARLFADRGADVYLIGDANWKSFATRINAPLYTTAEEITAFANEFVRNYPGKRKPLREAAMAQGKAAMRKQALEFKPCCIVIDNAERFSKDFNGEAQAKDRDFMQRLFSQMSSIAEYYNIFVFMSLSFSERMAASSEPLKSLAAQGRGIALGGKINEYDPWSLPIPAASRGKPLPAGYGYLTCDGALTQIVVPLAEPPEED